MCVRSLRVAKSLESRPLPQQTKELERNSSPPTIWKMSPTPCENARGGDGGVGRGFSELATCAFLGRQDFQAGCPPTGSNRLDKWRRQGFGFHFPRQCLVMVVQADVFGVGVAVGVEHDVTDVRRPIIRRPAQDAAIDEE